MICPNCKREYDTHENTYCPYCGTDKDDVYNEEYILTDMSEEDEGEKVKGFDNQEL